MFAPKSFSRRPNDGAHIVHHQPSTPEEVTQARAALAACPVAAIRVETQAHRSHRNQAHLTEEQKELVSNLAINPKFNGLALPFPRKVSDNVDDIYYVGHHNSASFGAAPYLLKTSNDDDDFWIMVDTPKYSKSAVNAVESLTGPSGPKYLVLTHVDDTSDHGKWKDHYPELKRVFHSGDLGRHNWIGDKTLENVEVLLDATSIDDPEAPLQYFDLDGNVLDDIDSDDTGDVVLAHTPGHSPGSISLWKRPSSSENAGVLFTGDTYSYSTRDGGHMSGFPRYGNNRKLQARILPKLVRDLKWRLLAPGHGHVRDYTKFEEGSEGDMSLQKEEMEAAIEELETY